MRHENVSTALEDPSCTLTIEKVLRFGVAQVISCPGFRARRLVHPVAGNLASALGTHAAAAVSHAKPFLHASTSLRVNTDKPCSKSLNYSRHRSA